MDQTNREYLTIGEIGKLTDINPKSIRYYERIGILEPARIDPETGYRYYRPEQIQKEPFYGRIAMFSQGRLEHLYAAVMVSSDTDSCPTLTLPAASYACLYTEEPQLLQAPALFPAQASSGQKMLVFESTCIASQFFAEAPGYILRYIPL